MKLLKIGRDASCDIVLHSPNVSSLHAELTLLNSGDMIVEDKDSRNGTYIMNQRIKPGKPVNVRRGDAIRFADIELQWSQVPMPEDNSAYQGVYGIGSHFNNDFQIAGATVSRYHATIKHGRDGKFYIVDHSKNGTTVDGVKIQRDQPHRIKRSSSVVCGGVPVDLNRLPWPSSVWKYVAGVAAAVLVLVGVGFGAYKIINSGGADLNALKNATARVFETYYVEVRLKDDPYVGRIAFNNGEKWPEVWQFGIGKDGKITLGTLTNNEIRPFVGSGTAFFISPDGELGTNRHMACPWMYLTNEDKDAIRQQLVRTIKAFAVWYTNNQSEVIKAEFFAKYYADMATQADLDLANEKLSNIDTWLTRINSTDYEIGGRFEYLGIALAGTNFTTVADLHACQVIAESGDEKRDVALMRLNSKQTPTDIVKNGYYDITKARVDENSLVVQDEELTTIGYPAEFGTDMRLVGDGKEILPVTHRTYISIAPDDNMFQLQGNTVGGQSGSPIIDSKHNLVGVVWASHRGTDVTYGCNIKHLKDLYDKHKARK